MKKAVVLLAIVLLMPALALAQESGIGIGWEQGTDFNSSGVSVRFPLGPLGIQGVANLSSVDPDDGDTETLFTVAGYVNFPLVDMGDSILKLFGGVGVETTTIDDEETNMFIRGGLQHDFFASDVIGISAKAGVDFFFERGIEDIDADDVNIFGFYGAVAMHWYFGGM